MKKLDERAASADEQRDARAFDARGSNASRPFTSVPKRMRARRELVENCWRATAVVAESDGRKASRSSGERTRQAREMTIAATATGFFRKRRSRAGRSGGERQPYEFDAAVEPRVGDIDDEVERDEQRAMTR